MNEPLHPHVYKTTKPRIPKSLPLRQIDTENNLSNHSSLAMPISYRFRRHLRVLRGCVAAATLASALLRASIDHSSSQQVSTNLHPPNKSLQAKLETATNAENSTFLLPNLTTQSTNLQNSLNSTQLNFPFWQFLLTSSSLLTSHFTIGSRHLLIS